MKLGLCLEMALMQMPFVNRFKKAAEIGFRNVEMWFVDDSFKGEPEALAEVASDAGVSITSTVIGSPDGGVGGGLTNPANRAAWLDRARFTIDYNRRAGIKAAIVCAGDVIPGMKHEAMLKSVVDGLKATLEFAESAGITLFLEPLNTTYDHAGHWLTSSDLGAEICRQTGSDRMRLLFDCYHMQIMEGDVAKHIERNLDVIGHVHAAGVPGRHEVFNNELDYVFVARQLDSLGYNGVMALEYKPTMESEISLRKSIEYLQEA